MTPDSAISSGTITVHVTDELVLTAGTWRQTLDRHNRLVARIEPPDIPMFTQVVEYLEARPVPSSSRVGLAEEARAAVAVCLRLGSYFAVLADPSHPLSPTVADQHTSQIDDEEMARLNIEISAALAWWFNLKGSGDQRYRSLVQSALAYLPLGRKTVSRSSPGGVLRECASKALSAELRHAWPSEWLDRDLQLAATHPIRIMANAVTLQSWRNGPVENVHAGRSVGQALHERRIRPNEEKAIIRHAQDGLYGAIQAIDHLVFDRAWPPTAERVLPFMRPFLLPRVWSCADYSRAIDLPLRAEAAIET